MTLPWLHGFSVFLGNPKTRRFLFAFGSNRVFSEAAFRLLRVQRKFGLEGFGTSETLSSTGSATKKYLLLVASRILRL